MNLYYIYILPKRDFCFVCKLEWFYSTISVFPAIIGMIRGINICMTDVLCTVK